MPVELNSVISSSDVRPGLRPVINFADLAGDVFLPDQPFAQRHVDLPIGSALPNVVDENTGPLNDPRVEFLVSRLVGADGGNMSTRVRSTRSSRGGPRAGVTVTTTSAPLTVRSRSVDVRIFKCLYFGCSSV